MSTRSTWPRSAVQVARRVAGNKALGLLFTAESEPLTCNLPMLRLRGLYGMIDRSGSPQRSHLEIATALLRAGVQFLQLRDKAATDANFCALVEELHPIVRASGAQLILNDRVEIARRYGGLGVHLGQDDMDPAKARDLLGPEVLIGWSTHSLEQVHLAQSLPLDYIGFGPVFSSSGKHLSSNDSRPNMEARGLSILTQAIKESRIPVVAIGGITADLLVETIRAGAESVAAIGAITQADDMMTVAQQFHQQLLRGSSE